MPIWSIFEEAHYRECRMNSKVLSFETRGYAQLPVRPAPRSRKSKEFADARSDPTI